ncbi:MAG TPA: VWA domain-containing protein [Vicinamibacterales bacterium]|jgi:VWFA-related protein|nr:VWA domain-containing protein [Vicinamibacterales bacterium]
MKKLGILAALVAASVSLAAQGGGQATGGQQPATPTFKSSAQLVVRNVTVKDKDGKVIEGLTAKDFVVTEDKEPQQIAFVEFQRMEKSAQTAVPLASAPPPTVKPPVPLEGQAPVISTPPGGGIRYQDRKLLVLYFDTASMFGGDLIRAYLNSRKYVEEQMSPGDLLAIMEYKGGAVRIRQDFTDDRPRLIEVINKMIYGEDQDGDGFPDNPELGTAFGQDDAEFNLFNTDRQLAALQTAISYLKPLPERKTLLYFSSGVRLNGADNMAQQRATVNAALKANVTLNPIDARGLVALTPMGDATQRSPGGLSMFTGQQSAQVMNSFQRSQDTLYSLAKDTGGTAMFDYNDLSAGIVKAADAVDSYYIIGYYTTHTATDGKFRRVDIATPETLQAKLEYNPGYYADKSYANFSSSERDRQLEEAFMQDDPYTELTLAMEVNYFQLNSAEYLIPVSIKIPGSELQLAKKRGAARTQIDFIGEIKDDNGYTQQNMREKLDVELSNQDVAALANSPIQYETGFTLLPGKYVIKLLARDTVTGRIGTYQAKFEVPNLEKETKRLPISTVVLSSQRVKQGDELYSVKKAEAAQAASPLMYGGEKLLPSVTRVFSKTKDMYVFLQAYERKYESMQPLVAFVTFYKGEQKAFETTPMAITDGRDPKSKAIPMAFTIPLQELPVGRYDVQVTVLEPQGQKAAFWQAPIVVAP